MIWQILGDIVTALVILVITAIVGIIVAGLRMLHKHMMKD